MKKITEDWNGQTPERKERIQRAFREGRFVVHALPCTTHTQLLEPEDLVRGLVMPRGCPARRANPCPGTRK